MNYYNEHDQKAAAWLRELIAAGHIPPGEVDTRSITEIKPDEIRDFTQCHFFAGIGGWPLALALAGVDSTRPIWTGSCPCQPFSVAGKGKGIKDERHLWPVFARLIAECRPPIVFGEQVASKAGRDWLHGVRSDLEGMGYAVGAADLCAAGVGAPHIRQRLYWVADAPSLPRAQQQREPRNGSWRGSAPDYAAECSGPCGVADANGDGRDQGRPSIAATGDDGAFGNGGIGGMGDTGAARLQARQREAVQPAGRRDQGGAVVQPGRPPSGMAHPSLPEGARLRSQCELLSGSAAWDSFDLLPCADGKTRRIESGTFPLAHGVPGRVGLLRGYGNAIVPQVAAEFVTAYFETH